MEHNGRLKVKFDFSFFAVVAFMIFVDTSGAAVLSLIACILHEGGHLLAMAVCGAYPERITFYGGGIALTRTGMDCLPDGKRIVILSAGCAVNLIVASSYLFMPDNGTAAVFCAVNLIICLFNALPIGYFDGAGILEILLSKFMSLRAAETVKRVIGRDYRRRDCVLRQLQQKRFIVAYFRGILSHTRPVHRIGLAISGFM